MGSRRPGYRLGNADPAASLRPSDRDAMAWSAWMCVEQTPELDFELQKCRLKINSTPDAELREFTTQLYQAWMLQ